MKLTKQNIALLLLLFSVFQLFAFRNWKTYTNTTHIYDMIEVDGSLYLATWGGVDVYDLAKKSFSETITVQDGLEDHDIRVLSYLGNSNTILFGTEKAGINRLTDKKFRIPINEIIGLPDNKINAIVNSDSLIYVGTNKGLTVFKDVPEFPYPLPINHYSTHNGLASERVSSLALSGNGYLLIGTDAGFHYVQTAAMFNIDAWKHFNQSNSPLPVNNINAVSINGNVLAVATRSGFLKITDIADFAEWTLYSSTSYPSFIKSNDIVAVYVADNSDIWFSYGNWNDEILNLEQSVSESINKISITGHFTVWKEGDEGLLSSKIKGFKEIDGILYAYSWGDGFFYRENDSWINVRANTIIANNITDIAADKNGKIWIANGFVGGGINRKGTRGVSGFDGVSWTNFEAKSSPLRTNNIFRVSVDKKNRKWFGGWGNGISVYDENSDIWYAYSTANGLPRNEIGEITNDAEGNIWISTYSGGMVVIDIDAIESTGFIPSLNSFALYSPNVQFSDVIKIFFGMDRIYFGSYYSGIRIWDDTSDPQTHQTGDSWIKPPVRNLIDGYVYIYGIDARDTYFGEEIWIAAESGLFMYDSSTDRWYRYTTGIKREIWQNNQWQNDRLYFVDEERIFGAVPTFPTAVYADDYNRIWIGTEANGITIYDLSSDRYTILNTNNSPLLSNKITALEYEPYSGNLFIGTDEGLNSLTVGRGLSSNEVPIKNTAVYPNPFRISTDGKVTIINKSSGNINDGSFSAGSKCRIYNTAGELIMSIAEDNIGEFSWNGRNAAGKQVGSGLYFYVVSSEAGEISKGTIAVIK